MVWEKLDKYYNLFDETPIYYTSLALYSAYRWNWFNETRADKPKRITKAKSIVYDV
jgi:hypothetical protein